VSSVSIYQIFQIKWLFLNNIQINWIAG